MHTGGSVLDAPRFDRLSKRLAAAGSRRRVLQALTGLSLGATALTLEAGEAQPARKRRRVAAEHWRKKKRYYCLDGKTIRRYRRKQKKLLAQGATRGKCTAPVCTPECTGKTCGPDGCGGTCGPGCTGETCCASDGTCVVGTTNDACGTGGNTCQVCVEPQQCIAFGCINIE